MARDNLTGDNMIGDYFLCGWRVHSNLPLPELLPWTGPAAAPVDVTIDVDAIPRAVIAQAEGRYLHVSNDGAILFQLPRSLRMLTRDGRRIMVDGGREDSRLFVLGTGLYHLCHQRGLFPLHAATVRLGRRTIAIAGHSGSGKSTLASALNRRGHVLLSDDTAVLEISSTAGIIVRPSFPRLHLWRDSLSGLGLGGDAAAPVRPGLEKFSLDVAAHFDPSPVALDAMLLLRQGAEPALRRLRPAAAVPLVQSYVQRPPLVDKLGRQAEVFAQSAAIAARVPVYEFGRPPSFDGLEAAAELIERTFSP